MDNIKIVKSTLNDKSLKLVVMKENKVVAVSEERGIKPLYTVYTKNLDLLEGAYVADRATGKAAAMLLVNGKIKGLYTDLISEVAIKVLEEGSIPYESKKVVPFILNRDGSDKCPIEKLSEDVIEVDELVVKIKNFLNGINNSK